MDDTSLLTLKSAVYNCLNTRNFSFLDFDLLFMGLNEK